MRVAIFSRFPASVDQPRGGVETVTLNMVRAMGAMDELDVHVVTLEPGRTGLEVETCLGARIHRLPAPRWPQMLDILFGPGRKKLRAYLVDLDPEVVHFHETYGLGIGELPMPHVFTIHGFDHANIPTEGRRFAWVRGRLWRRVEDWGIGRQKHIISITPYVREHIRGLTDATVHEIENPIAPGFFEIERKEVPGRVFTAGWISPRKNTLGVVRMFARVLERGFDATLHVAGEAADRPYYQKVLGTIEELGIKDRTRLLGCIPPDAMRGQLAEASVFILPSLQENSPMAIAESMAARLPVVSTNRCGMPYMIDEGRTGYLVDPDDVQTQADRVSALLADDGLRRRMGDEARIEAERRFHPETVARRTVEVYRLMIDEARKTAVVHAV